MDKESVTKIRSMLHIVSKTPDSDICYFTDKLNKLGFFDKLSENRQLALIALCCIYGFQSIINQTPLMFALESRDYERAYELLLSQGLRFSDIANVIKDDKINTRLEDS